MNRTALLLSAASLAALSAPAHAATILFSDSGSQAESQTLDEGAVTQIALENGAIVSIVGPASFSLRGEEIVINQGGVTVVGGNAPVVLQLPGEASARITGAGSLTVNANGLSGNVMGGNMLVTSGGSTLSFAAGQSWSADAGSQASLVFANGAQGTPQGGSGQTVADAAGVGMPVTLGEALAGVGASGDVIAAADNLEAYLASPAIGQLPSGNVASLLAFSDRLAAALGGASFEGASPAVVNAYLQYLVEGGQIGTFQAAYTQLVSQYLELLAQGGLAGDYAGADLTALNAYLAYLQEVDGLGGIGGAQQDLLAAYLDFLDSGGVPSEFVAPADLLNEDALAAYVAAITAYADFLASGGAPSDFGTSAAIIETYLSNIAAAGLLDELFGAQAAALSAYLEFLEAGGNPADFDGFDNGGPVLSDQLAAEYAAAIQAYVAFVQGGGAPGDFEGGADLIATYLQALKNAGLFNELLGAQAATLQAYLDFLAGGGAPADFEFGLSDQLAQQYAAAIEAFLDFIEAGGVPSEFSGLSGELFQAYLEALDTAGLFDTLLADQADFLEAYLAFLQDGGSLDDFDQLPDPISNEQKLAALQSFIEFVRADGLPSDFDGESLAALEAYFEDNSVASVFANDDAEAQAFLSEFFFYASGNDPDGFPALPANGGSTTTVQTAYSFTGADGSFVNTFGAYAKPVLLDADGKPIEGAFNGVPTNGSSIAVGADAVQSEYQVLANGDVTVSRLTGSDFTAGGQTFSLGANQGVHYAFVPALPGLPGDTTIDYELIGATSPTFIDGSSAPGTFDAAIRMMFAANGQTRLATEGSIAMPEDATYTFTTPGGLDGVAELDATTFITNPNTPLIQQGDIALTGTGKACLAGADCTLYMSALPGGQGAEYLGVSYESRNGGDGSIALHGAAAFQADAGNSGSGNGANGGNVEDFDTSFVSFAGALNKGSDQLLQFVSSQGPATFGEDYVIETVSREGMSDAFDRGDVPLIEQSNGDHVILARYGSGELDGYFGTQSTLDSVFAFTSTPETLLPTMGAVTYQMDRALPVTTNNPDLDPGTFDATLAVLFGPVAKAALEGSIVLDTTYTFSTPGGIANPEMSDRPLSSPEATLLAPLTGAGAICAEGDSCNLIADVAFTDEFNQAGMAFYTRGGDFMAAGSAAFVAEDTSSISFDAGAGAASGSLAAAYGGDDAMISLADGGGLNRRRLSTNSYFTPQLGGDLTFDERGLSKAIFNLTSATRTLIDRADAQVADLQGAAEWQIGRFTGGSIESDYGFAGSITDANSGLAYALVAPVTSMPDSGTIDYSLLAATRPVYGDGSATSGSFDASLRLLFGSDPRLAAQGSVTMPDATYSFETTGGLADPSQSQLRLYTDTGRFVGPAVEVAVTGNGAACISGEACSARLDGGIGGDSGSLASLGYVIFPVNSYRPTLSGSAVFEGDYTPADDGLPDGTTVADQIVTYASTVVGIDTRNTAEVIYSDTTGAPLAHHWKLNDYTSENERPNIGSNTEHESGSVAGVIGWTRWSGGETGGRYFNLQTATIPENSGWHEVAGTPATNLPASGTVQYELVGSTNPTIRDGSQAPGSFSGDLAVAFGATPTVGVELDVSIGGNSYAINTPGGVADPMAGGMQVDANMEFSTTFDQVHAQGSGPVCGGSGDCRVDMRGFLAGEGASHVGLTYTFGNNGFDQQVDGSAVFGASAP